MGEAAMGFVGVDTAHSSIMTVFPRWADHLGLPTRRLRGHDVALDSADAVYRVLVGEIKRDDAYLGALVTTHKIRVYEAALDLFDEVDDASTQCGEISSISKRGGRLRGAAKDPLTAGLALREFLGDDWFARTGGEVVCLGAGGAGTAISTSLAQHRDRPARITVADVETDRLAHLRGIHERTGLDADLFRYVDVTSLGDAGALVAGAAPGSLVVNATGLGKDRPGSPIEPATTFPREAAVWELNYRGALDFLHQAEAQRAERELTVVDGWRYFVHGWTQVIADVFDIPMPAATVEELATLAESVR
ncbi:MAG: shikimate dehydrogenase family protein [Actinomycetes bacterium]